MILSSYSLVSCIILNDLFTLLGISFHGDYSTDYTDIENVLNNNVDVTILLS